jgi:hypothetical protein
MLIYHPILEICLIIGLLLIVLYFIIQYVNYMTNYKWMINFGKILVLIYIIIKIWVVVG